MEFDDFGNIKTCHFGSFQAAGAFWKDAADNFECDWFKRELLGWSGARVMKVYLYGSFVAGLAGAKFFKIFNVYLCGSFIAGLAGATFFKIFNVYLCGSYLAGLAGAKIFKILIVTCAAPS